MFGSLLKVHTVHGVPHSYTRHVLFMFVACEHPFFKCARARKRYPSVDVSMCVHVYIDERKERDCDKYLRYGKKNI